MKHIINKEIEKYILSGNHDLTELAVVLTLLNRTTKCDHDVEMAKTDSGILLPKHIVQAGNYIVVHDNKLILPSAIIESISSEAVLLRIFENIKREEELLHIVHAITGDLKKTTLLIRDDFLRTFPKFMLSII